MNGPERHDKIERWEKARVRHTTDTVFSAFGMVMLRISSEVVNITEHASVSSLVGVIENVTNVGSGVLGVVALVSGHRAFRDAHAIEALEAGHDTRYQTDFAQYEPAQDSE